MRRPSPWVVTGLIAGAGCLLLLFWLRGLGSGAPGGSPSHPPESGSGAAAPVERTDLNPQEQIGQRWLKPAGTEHAYAGDAACKSCHPREFATQSHTPHAATARRLAEGEVLPEFRSTDRVTDPRSQITYGVHVDKQQNWLLATSPSGTNQAPVRWIMGSGRHARTYLCVGKTRFLESRISFYSKTRHWNFTPGRGPNDPPTEPLGNAFDPLEAASCFGCHSTLVVGDANGLDLTHSRPNIGCEACHGPSRRHVEEVTRFIQTKQPASASVPFARPVRPSGAASMPVCGACHRLPGDVKGGDPLLERQLARFPGVALMRSRCYLESGGRLTCLTCHNPHETAPSAPKAYDRACQGCHAPPDGHVCAARQTEKCVTCHLTPERISSHLPLEFHNHWIRRTAAGIGKG